MVLKLTIPVDIYSSPILVEAHGIECQLRVKEQDRLPTQRTKHDWDQKREHLTSPSLPKSRSKSHDLRKRSKVDGDDDVDSSIPTAVDLAESFLQTEPDEDKVELEAAILSESPEISSSYASIQDGESEVPMGTGTALSLPTFMARFLTGIIDRLQIRIHGVTLTLDVEIPDETSRSSTSPLTDPVTFQLKVGNIDIEGVTQDEEQTTAANDAAPKFLYKEGKRLVSLTQIQGALISEADIFSSHARSSMSSPSATHSDMFDRRKMPTRTRHSKRDSESRSFDSASLSGRLSSASSSRLSSRSLPKKTSSPPSLHGSAIASDSGRFDDAPEDDDVTSQLGSLAAGLESELEESTVQKSQYLDQLTESQYLQSNEQEDGKSTSPLLATSDRLSLSPGSPLSPPRVSIHAPFSVQQSSSHKFSDSHPSADGRTGSALRSTILPTRQHSRFSQGRVSQSQPSLSDEPSLSVDVVHEQPVPYVPQETDDTIEAEDEDDISTPVGEDLVQSQIFSHEDAESIYMSAISYDTSAESVPGGFARSSVDSDNPLSDPRASISHQSQETPQDNLKHAHHSSPAKSSSDLPGLAQPFGSSSPPIQGSVAGPSHLPTTSTRENSSVIHTPSNRSERSAAFSDEYHRITKHIFDIDKIAIYLPGATIEQSPESPQAGPSNAMLSSALNFQDDIRRSASINIPGAFSTHLPVGYTPTPAVSHTVPPETKRVKTVDTSIEVKVGRVLAHFDVSAGTLIWLLVSRLKDVLNQDSSIVTPMESYPALSDMDLKFGAEEISIAFLERLEGSLNSPASGSIAQPEANLPESDILLRTTVNGLRVETHATPSKSETAVTIKKFVLGYAQDNILSFDANLQMRASVRDLNASAGIDVSINICKTANSTRFDIKTLPLHLSIDLQKLDETFSWFGGLSSVLNLGSSIASNATITTASPNKTKARGVRFEVPLSPDDKSLAAQNKTDIRIGGFILDLVGAECTVGVETSAVKIVSRDEGIGVGVQKIRLSGPHLRESIESPAIDVEITTTRVEYLPSPKDIDLDALLSLITPSKVKYDQDDDILLETLLRQRKQGAVLRLSVDDFEVRIGKLDKLSYLPELGEEISRLSTVAKYLPDDDRPGLLSLIKVNRFGAQVDVGHSFGTLQITAKAIEVAQITFPALAAFSINFISLFRNGAEELLGPATDPELREPHSRAPAIMARMIGDEMEPIVKIKLWNLKLEYRVPTLIALLDLAENASNRSTSANLATSVATVTDLVRSTVLGLRHNEESQAKKPNSASKPMTIDIVLRDCIVGLNPISSVSKVLIVLTETHLSAILPKDREFSATADMGKASLLVIDNVANITSGNRGVRPRRQSFDGGSSQVADLCTTGFVSVSYISSAKAIVRMSTDEDGEQSIDVELRDDLLVLETCADSTQTLINVLNGLTPPNPPSKDIKYRTKVIPVKDLLASLSGDAFGTAEGDYNFDDDFDVPGVEGIGGEESDDFDIDSHYYQLADDKYDEALLGRVNASSASTQLTSRDTHDGVLLESFVEPEEGVDDSTVLEFQENHFGTNSILEGTAHRWNSTKNTYDRSNSYKVQKSPLKICVRDVHIIWNLFDGYDWQHTRDAISRAVQDVESKAIEKRARNERRPTFEQDIEDEETVIGDFLFNSIYIGIPANRDPRELTSAINQELNDNATETESVATTSLSPSPNRQGFSRTSSKKLRLKRSKHHKITFELKGVCADFVAFPPGTGETRNSIDVRVHDFEIFDHVPTSTWRKFATYMQDAGERETGSNMIHIEILNVKPVPELAASEIVLKATILPLRLHVDQDALDFITRFFEFKDDSAPAHYSPGDVPFLQRVEVNSVQVKLDFKPKRVDYAGLRSGHTTEFMNFLILDEADMVLRHTIIYGISGFDKLGKTLNDIWMPDIKRNQLPGILAGLAPVRSIVNVGGGLRHLVLVPMREYQKDGRIVRSISRGAAAFAKTTGTELVKLGAKVAIGVQTVLQGAEGLLSPAAEPSMTGIEREDEDEESKQISLYANQPVGVLQGLRGGYDGLQRDLILARDAIIAVPGEVMEGGNAAGVLQAVRKHAPTVILRPAIGVAKAGGQILMGATNALDPSNLQRADAVS